MKKVKYLAMLLAAGMFAACSDNLEDTGAGNAGGTTPATGEGYVKVAINMPTTSGTGTRANSKNNNFDNGTSNEYEVGSDNWIIFFADATTGGEDAAKIVGATPLTDLSFGTANQNSNNITTTSTAIIDKVPLTTNKALVILNANKLISYSNDKLTVTGITGNISTFGTLKTAISEQQVSTWIGSDKNSFLMTNAPLATLPGNNPEGLSTQNVTTLAAVNVYPDEETAQTAASDQVYVERAVAKVTISNFPTTIDLNKVDNDNPLNGASVTLQGWILDNTNSSVKLVRDVQGNNNGWSTWTSITNTATSTSENRFFGLVSPHRVYWAIDDNYDATSTTGITNITNADTWNSSIGTSEAPVAAYCFENTFPMSENAGGSLVSEAVATRVLFRMQVTPKIKEDGSAAGSEDTPATDFILFGGTSAVYTKTTFINYVNEYIAADATLNTTYLESLDDGVIFDSAEKLYGQNGLFSNGVTETNAAAVLAALGNEVRFYKNNVMYTDAAYIKHFGEAYTPIVETVTSPQSYLGRYGVVRNNWYELNVTKVGIGSPVIPDDDGNLDEKEAYMNVQINVLSWAKRTQDVDL